MNASTAEISVTDTGVGIAPEDQEAIFEEFRQVGTADKKVEGAALGLSLARKFIEAPWGTDLGEEPVGAGLDVHVHAASAARRSSSATVNPEAHGLIVDSSQGDTGKPFGFPARAQRDSTLLEPRSAGFKFPTSTEPAQFRRSVLDRPDAA